MLSGPSGVEVGAGVVDVDGPMSRVRIASEPVVEAQAVQVWSRADLENNVALTAAVRCAGWDHEELMRLGRERPNVALDLERQRSEERRVGEECRSRWS